MHESSLTRVMVIGTSGAGKTTFARRLAKLLGTPHIELDALHWGPNWTVREDFRDAVFAASERSAWVADGNYSAVRDRLWRRATLIVWLNYPFGLVLGRALRRTIGRVVSRERLYADNRETLWRALFDLDGVPWWIIRTHHRRRREILKLMARAEYAHARFVVLHSPKAAEAFLKAIGAA